MFSSLFRSPQPAPASVTSSTATATATASASTTSPTPTIANTNTNTTPSRSSSTRPSASSPGLPSTTSASSVSSPRAHPFAAAHPHPHGLAPAPPAAGVSHGTAVAGSRTSTSTAPVPPTPSTQRQIDEARNAVVASIGNILDRELSGRAALLHANNAAIERQERDVSRAVDGLRRDNDKLARLAAEHTRKVKEIGNVQNWAEMLEREFLIIEETLRMVREGSDDDDGSGSEWSGSECPEGCQCGRGVDGEEDVVMGEWGGDGKGKGKEVERVVAPEMVPIPESPLAGEASGRL